MLLQCQQFLRQKKVASLQQIARCLGCQESAVEPMLQHLIRAGQCRRMSHENNKLPATRAGQFGSVLAKATITAPVHTGSLATSTPAAATACGPCGGACHRPISAAFAPVKARARVFYQWLSKD